MLARNGRANRAVECLMLGADRKTCALREHFAFWPDSDIGRIEIPQ